jgi:uncharacterized protein YraI
MANGTATTTTNLNLRSGPGTGSSILYTIPGQTAITLTGIANNGWYPVTVNGKTGFVSGDYLKGITQYTPTPTTPGTPTTPTPTTPAIPTFNQQSNPFYKPTSQYGSTQNWYDTPIVKQSAGFDAEFEKYITDQGFGGMNQKGDFARSLTDRAKSGYASAQLNNPALTNRQYLADLGSNFLAKARATATPQQRGEQWGIMAPRARWTSRS